MIRWKTRIDRHHTLEAHAQQASSNQEDEGDGNLGDNKAMPKVLSAAAGSGPSRFSSKSSVRLLVQIEPRNNTANKNAKEHYGHHRNQGQPPIEGYMRTERQLICAKH